MTADLEGAVLMDVREYIDKNILIFDGAMGTMLQKYLKPGEIPETLNINQSEKIIEIHKKYIDAGAKAILTNTFGANRLKLKDTSFTPGDVICTAISNARKASMNKDVFVALDIGPIGELIEPMGTLKFEEAYEIFKEQVNEGVKCNVDFIVIETMTDIYEAKAAVLAAKENSSLPVFCTMSFQKDNRTFTGCGAKSMALMLQGLNVDAIGVNCSLGPRDMEPVVSEILKYSNVPVMVKPNAGLPEECGCSLKYNVSPDEFADFACRFVNMGVRIIGGCCGTTPEYIEKIRKNINGLKIKKNETKAYSAVCTPSKVTFIDGIKVVGERLNPTGKKKLKEAIINDEMDYILNEAISEVQSGADILDINAGIVGINEEEKMVKIIKAVESVLDVPVQIDSSNPKVLEAALRVCRGKAIVNSVNGRKDSLKKILPIVKKYGSAVIGLTIDENGIPETAEKRFEIAENIIKSAEEYGIKKQDVIIDCLTLTAASNQNEVMEALKALRLVKEKLNVKTTLGISNVSYGLPGRKLLNRTFLAACLLNGLDLPIINPLDKDMMETVLASKVLINEDIGAEEYIKSFKDEKTVIADDKKHDSLYDVVVKGIKYEAKNAAKNALKSSRAMDVIDKIIVPAMNEVGDRYEKGEIFLPQLIQSAETVKSAFEIINDELRKDSGQREGKGRIILATVRGDIHDIGKNIVKVLLQSYGFEVIDLGKDVPEEKIVEETIKNDIKLVGLSALMTTTVSSMENTIKLLREHCPGCRVMVGGAVLNEKYAHSIGADFYAEDAKVSVEIAKRCFNN